MNQIDETSYYMKIIEHNEMVNNLEKQEYCFLDQIPIIEIIEKEHFDTVRDIIEYLEDKYTYAYLNFIKKDSNLIKDESIFNAISENMFIDYLSRRYKDKINIYSETSYYIQLKNKRKE